MILNPKQIGAMFDAFYISMSDDDLAAVATQVHDRPSSLVQLQSVLQNPRSKHIFIENLIQWAQLNGRVADLILTGVQHIPENESLRQLSFLYLKWVQADVDSVPDGEHLSDCDRLIGEVNRSMADRKFERAFDIVLFIQHKRPDCKGLLPWTAQDLRQLRKLDYAHRAGKLFRSICDKPEYKPVYDLYSAALKDLGRLSFFKWIPFAAGNFTMSEEAGGQTVEMLTYFVAEAPVTQAQYEEFLYATVLANPREYPRLKAAWDIYVHQEQGDKQNQAVTGVRMLEAEAFCCWYKQGTGLEVRLASEAEYERARDKLDMGGLRGEWTGSRDPQSLFRREPWIVRENSDREPNWNQLGWSGVPLRYSSGSRMISEGRFRVEELFRSNDVGFRLVFGPGQINARHK